MDLFQHTPPRREAAHNLPIVRTAARGKTGGIVLAEGLTGTWTHFYGRTTPCTTQPTCPICARGNEPRWTGYLPCWLPKALTPFLLELPTAAAEQVATWIAANGSIRHKMITATRPRGKANSRIKISIETRQTDCYNLPATPDVEATLCLIWKLDPNDIDGSLKSRMAEIERYQLQEASGNGHTTA